MEENEQTQQKPALTKESVETLKSQISDFTLQRYALEEALNIYKYNENNYLNILALKIADAEKKIALINSNIKALQTNIDESQTQ